MAFLCVCKPPGSHLFTRGPGGLNLASVRLPGTYCVFFTYIFFVEKIFLKCVCMSLGMPVCAGALGHQKRPPDTLELDQPEFLNATWVL